MQTFMILLFVIAVIAFYVIFLYNGVVTLKNRTEEAWSDIDVQLKRRYDLIPNLVETVKGYAKHEEGVFTKVTEARAKAISAQGAAEQAQAENVLKDALKSLFAVVENYPELKANSNFLKLQEDLKETENKIEASRRFYNGNVRDFNTKIQKFPNNLIAGQLGFSEFEYFEIGDDSHRENVKVDFGSGTGGAERAGGVEGKAPEVKTGTGGEMGEKKVEDKGKATQVEKPAEPEVKPAEPEVKPAEPEVKPAEPATPAPEENKGTMGIEDKGEAAQVEEKKEEPAPAEKPAAPAPEVKQEEAPQAEEKPAEKKE